MSGPTFAVELFQYPPPRTILEEVRLAERLGYDAVWLGDAQLLWRELYVMLGAAAALTSSIALGSSVTNPVTRLPSVTAGAVATLHELSEGRARLGIGVGGTSTGMVGAPSATRAHLAQYVRDVRALCDGQALAGPHGDMRLVYASAQTHPPLYIGGSGPKVLALAGEIADGAIIGGGTCSPERLASKLGAVREGRARAAPDAPFRVCLSATTAVHADRALALAAARPAVAVNLRFTDPSWPLSDAARRAREAVMEIYRHDEHMSPDAAAKFAAAIPDAVVDEFAIAGTPDECRARAAAIFAAGVDEIITNPYGVAGGPRSATIEAFARAVMAPLRAEHAGAARG
jgi:5,10-methylenetetrahydromethanopterin reductase